MSKQSIHHVIFFPLQNEPELGVVLNLLLEVKGRDDLKGLKHSYQSIRTYHNAHNLNYLQSILDFHKEFTDQIIPDTEPDVIREMHLLDANHQIRQLTEMIALKSILKKLPPHKRLINDQVLISHILELVRP
jgi:hypothetical protein